MKLAATEVLKPFETEYLEAVESQRLNYSVALPTEEEYTARFDFREGVVVKDKSDRANASKMYSWMGVPGSAVGSSIAPEAIALPNGKMLRLFHSSQKRNARTPTPEASEARPDTLMMLGMVSLPPLLQTPCPDEHDVPRLSQTVELVAPRPCIALLSHTIPPPSFGKILLEPFVVDVEEDSDDAAAKKNSRPATEHRDGLANDFVLSQSVFGPRKRQSDARSFYTTAAVRARAFDIDWSRCSGPRFRMLIARRDDGGGLTADEELSEVEQVMQSFAPTFYPLYTWCSMLGQALDGYAIGRSSFMKFLVTIRVIDEESPYCTTSHL